VSTVLRIARRELRGGIVGLRIVLACLALGVAAIAAIGSLREGISRGLQQDGTRILGGDIDVLGGAQPLPAAVKGWLGARGARLSEIVTLRSMLIAPNGERMLVELKAVDRPWPLIGAVGFTPEMGKEPALGAKDGRFGIAVEQAVLARLGVEPGAVLRLGNASLELRAVVAAELKEL
jgi:putative ABC transport system permease protein